MRPGCAPGSFWLLWLGLPWLPDLQQNLPSTLNENASDTSSLENRPGAWYVGHPRCLMLCRPKQPSACARYHCRSWRPSRFLLPEASGRSVRDLISWDTAGSSQTGRLLYIIVRRTSTTGMSEARTSVGQRTGLLSIVCCMLCLTMRQSAGKTAIFAKYFCICDPVAVG